MLVKWVDSKILVEPVGIEVINYPLDWIEGFDGRGVDDISLTLFGMPYKEMDRWSFISVSSRGGATKRIEYSKRVYREMHLGSKGRIISDYKENESYFWRGIYFPDLGMYGRLGGAHKKIKGKGRFPNLLNYYDEDGGLVESLVSKDTISDLKEADINFVVPGYLQTPPPEITLDYLSKHGLFAIYNLGGPYGGQPLAKDTLGVGKLSELGSVWYNYPKEYINEYHAPGEKFFLDEELSIADNHKAIIAIQQQDEPRYTELYEERYQLIKRKVKKAVFCTFNWGVFYNSSYRQYNLLREEIIRNIFRVTDIYVANLYIHSFDLASLNRQFKDYGPPSENVWRLVDRHRAEMGVLSKVGGRSSTMPRWLVLQGFGEQPGEASSSYVMPDPKFMFAQIWASVCLGVTGVLIYSQHTAGTEASKERLRSEGKGAPLYDGISPDGPNVTTWRAMSKAYSLIRKYEEALLTETIKVQISDDNRILTMLKQLGNQLILFSINTYREKIKVSLDFTPLPGDRIKLRTSVKGFNKGIVNNEIHVCVYDPFELRIFEFERVSC